MQKRPNIILTGFMGSGKSTIGKLLAVALGYAFVDTDQLIEKRHGTTIAALFQKDGEEAFRRLEAELAQELATGQGMVIATGGRLMLDTGNAAILSKDAAVFCLHASEQETLRRLRAESREKRPLLAGENPECRVRELLAERREGYRNFTQVDTTGKTPVEVVAELQRLLANTTASK